MNIHSNRFAVAFLFLAALTTDAMAQTSCSSTASRITAVGENAAISITANFAGQPQFQPLLSTSVVTTTPGCLVAHLSGTVRVSDNSVMLQVVVDGHAIGIGQSPLGPAATPVVFTSVASPLPAPYNDALYLDRVKEVSFNFFERLAAGNHVIQVLGAAGDSANPQSYFNNPSSVSNLVLTLEHP
jgi:hypothetical protein